MLPSSLTMHLTAMLEINDEHSVLDSFAMERTELDSRLIPVCVAGVSAFLLFLYLIPVSRNSRAISSEAFPETRSHVAIHGGPRIFAYMVARLVGCLILLGLSLATSVVEHQTHESNPAQMLPLQYEFVQLAVCASYFYMSLLAFIAVLASPQLSKWVTRHLSFLLLVTFAVDAYRDFWPLATFTEVPKDISEGWLLWAKLFFISIVAVVVPLAIPRRYAPVDSKEFMSELNPEQTASLISRLCYSFLDPFVFLAYRLPRLNYEQLPPLADYDYARNLVKDSFPVLDPFSGGKNVYIFWGLMRVFKREYFSMAVLQLVLMVVGFASPLGINRLLNFLETNGDGAIIKPWFWVSWLFCGPLLRAIISQWSSYIATRAMVQAEGTLTQLIFRHSLRIRLDSESTDERNSVPSKNLVGKINNLVTTDLANITSVAELWLVVIYGPLQLVLCICFLYVILSWSALVGFAVMIALFPLPGYLTRLMRGVQVAKMKKTDARVQSVTEAMSILRMVKLFGWEHKMKDRIAKKREEELTFIKKSKILQLLTTNLNFVIPLVTMISTYSTYTLVMKRELTASNVFSSIAVFDMLRTQLRMVINITPAVVEAKVSLDRIDDFLKHTPLLDAFSGESTAGSGSDGATRDEYVIGFRDTQFSWSNENKGSFKLQIKGEVIFKQGCINLIFGPTGSGKTSLLMALLGEMHCSSLGPNSWFNLPRSRGVAYVSQESWVQNESIRDNILFGAPFDEERYNKVIYQCALQRDLALFESGDSSEVGEKGLTLSGGQKARITLARAIYSTAGILLLDDTLAALDVHTAKWIVDKCFTGDLIRGRTVLLVTHNVAIARPIAKFAVTLGLDGLLSQGSMTDVLAMDDTAAAGQADEQIAEKEQADISEATMKNPTSAGKLVIEEEVEQGHVKWPAFKLYVSSLSSHPIIFWIVMLFTTLLNETSIAVQSWFLGFWSSQYERHAASEVVVTFYLTVYSLLLMVSVMLYTFAYSFLVFGSLRSSKVIHSQLIESVVGTTMRWLDTTPASRVIARATQDIRRVDGPIASGLWWLTMHTLSMFVKFCAVVLFSPAFVVPGIVITFLGVCFGQLYMLAQLPVKREMSNARSPVLGHFGAAMAGLTSIRAYGAQDTFLQESLRRIDRYTRAARTFYNLNRWICIRSDALGGLFTAGLGGYLVYGSHEATAANTGFSLIMAVGFSSMILAWVRILNGFELHGNSLERILHYINIEQEPKPCSTMVPPAYWPASGDILVENLSAQYSEAGPKVLHDISFHINCGEHVGVVGRTGSGKSSLTLALLRCIPTEGTVYYDGIPTTSVNLDALRSSITVIPQIPELLSGTLRQNLDPFSQFEDSTLNDALRSAGLYSLQIDVGRDMLVLDSSISSGGSNLSVGQRQIIALARAIARGSKLLIMDEATSAVDYRTDSVIQSSLRHELGDITLITVAHRLKTIMDFDKILVLDEGRIVEFDRPDVLLQNENGMLRALVDESADKSVLHAMARE